MCRIAGRGLRACTSPITKTRTGGCPRLPSIMCSDMGGSPASAAGGIGLRYCARPGGARWSGAVRKACSRNGRSSGSTSARPFAVRFGRGSIPNAGAAPNCDEAIVAALPTKMLRRSVTATWLPPFVFVCFARCDHLGWTGSLRPERPLCPNTVRSDSSPEAENPSARPRRASLRRRSVCRPPAPPGVAPLRAVPATCLRSAAPR